MGWLYGYAIAIIGNMEQEVKWAADGNAVWRLWSNSDGVLAVHLCMLGSPVGMSSESHRVDVVEALIFEAAHRPLRPCEPETRCTLVIQESWPAVPCFQ